jgi:hypothetical protein
LNPYEPPKTMCPDKYQSNNIKKKLGIGHHYQEISNQQIKISIYMASSRIIKEEEAI